MFVHIFNCIYLSHNDRFFFYQDEPKFYRQTQILNRIAKRNCFVTKVKGSISKTPMWVKLLRALLTASPELNAVFPCLMIGLNWKHSSCCNFIVKSTGLNTRRSAVRRGAHHVCYKHSWGTDIYSLRGNQINSGGVMTATVNLIIDYAAFLWLPLPGFGVILCVYIKGFFLL